MSPRSSKHVEDNRNLKLNINSENYAFGWLMLRNSMTISALSTFFFFRFQPVTSTKD